MTGPFSEGAFNQHFALMGQDVFWRRAYVCPCMRPGEDSADPACKLCRGRGFQWEPEAEVRVGLTAQSEKKGMADFGTWEAGDAVVSIPADCPVYETAGRMDRIRAKHATSVFSDALRRGFTDRLVGSIVKIERVFWLNDAKDAVIEGKIPVVNAAGSLAWPEGGAPPEGARYSITGVRFNEFYVYPALPTDRAMGNQRLPRKLLVRRMDLFGR